MRRQDTYHSEQRASTAKLKLLYKKVEQGINFWRLRTFSGENLQRGLVIDERHRIKPLSQLISYSGRSISNWEQHSCAKQVRPWREWFPAQPGNSDAAFERRMERRCNRASDGSLWIFIFVLHSSPSTLGPLLFHIVIYVFSHLISILLFCLIKRSSRQLTYK